MSSLYGIAGVLMLGLGVSTIIVTGAPVYEQFILGVLLLQLQGIVRK